MLCKRCGAEIGQETRYCPDCGIEIEPETKGATAQSWKSYGYYTPKQPSPHFDEDNFPQNQPQSEQPFSSSHSTYSSYNAQPYQRYNQHDWYNQSDQSYHQQYRAPLYTTQTSGVSNNNSNALLLEVILSLFGIFGVGWLLAGETTTGIVLLVCSIVVYWPFMIFGTLLTFGLGLICLGPLAITAIIVNALVFNTILRRKRPQQPLPPMPPPPMY